MGNLVSGNNQPSRRVKDEVEGHIGVRHVNRPDDLLRVIDIDVSEDGKTQETHGFLSVNENNNSGTSFLLKRGDKSLPHGHKQWFLHERLYGGKDEEKPE